jgi:hypothetical protein
MQSTTVPIRGDISYKNRIKKLAALKEVQMADLVRQAIDRVFGDELDQLDSFFADIVPYVEQLEQNRNEE